MKQAKEIRTTSIYAGRIVNLSTHDVVLPNGHEVRLEIVHHPGAAAVVPLHSDGTVTLIHQYRHAAGGFIYEIPAGLLEAGEAPIACAGRELQEETGLAAAELVPLVAYHTTPGFSDEIIHIFVGRNLTEGEAAPEADEVLTCVRWPLDEAVARIYRGEITDGKTIIALLAVAGQGNRP